MIYFIKIDSEKIMELICKLHPMVEDNIGYNSAYISLNLLDELDYCLGGYGKPNVEFIFSLNTFVESFIASSEFYTSLDELNHLNLTTPALFPNGRPALNMVVKATGLKFVNGVIQSPGSEIYREFTLNRTRKESQQDFIMEFGNRISERYFIKSDVNNLIDKVPLVTSRFENDEFIVSEVLTTSAELVSNLMSVSSSTSIQTAIPIYLYDRQISSLNRTPYSIKSLEMVAKLHEANLEELKVSLNYQYLPIPPFANILLSQVTSISEIPQKLVQLRADYQELRDKFVELEQDIHGALKLKEQQEAFKKFTEFWSTFNKKYIDKKHRIFYGNLDLLDGGDLGKASESVVDGAALAEGIKDLNLVKLAGNLFSKGIDWEKDRRIINRFKGLTNIWELFQESNSITQQLNHFERLFSVKYSNAEINNVHEFVKTALTNLTPRIS